MRLDQSNNFRRPLKSRVCAFACGALLLLGAVPALSSAQSSVYDRGSETSLSFARETAELVGSDALVLVHCNGSAGDTCSGTLTLSFAGRKQKAPFSVIAGTSQSVSVPVGDSAQLADRRTLAVARTAQSTGRFNRSSEVLHFR